MNDNIDAAEVTELVSGLASLRTSSDRVVSFSPAFPLDNRPRPDSKTPSEWDDPEDDILPSILPITWAPKKPAISDRKRASHKSHANKAEAVPRRRCGPCGAYKDASSHNNKQRPSQKFRGKTSRDVRRKLFSY